jgi:hypothetical protein
MNKLNVELLKEELSQSLSKPFRLPLNLAIAAIGTLAFIFAGIFINTFHRGLPYISANIFIWTLATFNASQLGSDSNNVLAYLKNKSSIRQLFLIKNISLLILALPIDILLIVLACSVLNDWSNFVQSIVVGLCAVLICLGLGNIVSTLWVYKPQSILKIRHNRLQIYEYSVFLTLAYSSATISLLIAAIPAEIIIHTINYRIFPGSIIALLIMLVWTVTIWLITLRISTNITKKYHDRFIGRLNGKPVIVNSPRLKKILKIK